MKANPLFPRWDEYESVLCEVEGRNPETGRIENTPAYVRERLDRPPKNNSRIVNFDKLEEQRIARNKRNLEYMKKRRAKWVAMGLTVLGKPRKTIV